MTYGHFRDIDEYAMRWRRELAGHWGWVAAGSAAVFVAMGAGFRGWATWLASPLVHGVRLRPPVSVSSLCGDAPTCYARRTRSKPCGRARPPERRNRRRGVPMAESLNSARREYAVVWKRVGLRPKRRIFVRRAAADRRLVLLGPEPWLAFGKSGDEPACDHDDNDRYECGPCDRCHLTRREYETKARADFPPLEYLRLETRCVTDWTPDASPTPRAVAVPSASQENTDQ